MPASKLRRRLSRAARLPALLRRARVFEEPLRFMRAELRAEPAIATYTLRSTRLKACYRHHSPDMGALTDIFVAREYDFPPAIARRVAEHERLRVLDLGGHVGYFALFAFSALPSPEVVSFEPDPANGDVLARCIALNGLDGRWQLRRACAATADGSVAFRAEGSTGSHRVPAANGAGTIQVAAIDVLPMLGRFDLVKLDIEGAEWDILHDPRFAEMAPPILALEYHVRGSRTPRPSEEAHALLAAGGYRVLPITEKYGTMGSVWAFKEGAATCSRS